MKKIFFFISFILVFFFLIVMLKAQSRTSYVRFRFTYHLGTNKTNDFYKFAELSGSIDEQNINIVGYPNNLSHFYFCTYDEEEFDKGMLASLIYSGKTQDLNSIIFSATQAEDYKAEVKQKIEGTNLILVFTNGTCEKIDKKIYTIEKYGLPSQPFSVYPQASGLSILMILRNDKISIRGSETFGPGTNRICIEYSSTTKENKPIIEVRKC